MGKSMSGIDWTDAMVMIGAIGALHECTVVLTVTTVGQAHNGHCATELRATFNVLPGSDLPKEVKVEGKYPHPSARTFEGFVYNLAWQLDYAIQQAYEQMKLPIKA
jgi:hypothetical protein